MNSEDNQESPELSKGESAAIDGMIREYARTGSAGDDEQLISGINQKIEGADEPISLKDNKWVMGSSFWGVTAAAAAAVALFLGIQSYSVYNTSADPTEIQAFTQSRFSPGSIGSIRAQVRDANLMKPVANAQVNTFLVSTTNQRIPFGESFSTDSNGFVLVSAEVPADLEEGDYTIEINAKGATGKATLQKEIPITRSYRTMLSSDKPLYQPGQIIHLRALSLNNDSMAPEAGRAVGFEVHDPKGNKVFGKKLKTSDFGIAAADFQLANQVNEGNYTITATVGDTASKRTVKVERYTLPKYKINLASDRPYYAPGDIAEITIDCQYTFGKPVANGQVKIIAQEFIERFRDFETLSGKTDENGRLTFQLPLKDAFVGQPLNKGNAFVRLIAEVKDPANEVRKTTSEFKVTNKPIQIEVFPESGELVKNVENKVYILTAYPDGTPAQTTITLGKGAGKTIETSAMGIGSVQLTPTTPNLKLTLQARDKNGASSRVVKPLRIGKRNDAFLLRTDKAVYLNGDTLKLDVFSATKARRVFLDVVKNGRSALSQAIEVNNGTGQLALDLPADLVGTLQLQAYSILDNGELIRDTKVIQVNRNNGLTVTASLNKETYRPAEKAIIDFLVTGKDGSAVPAALSLAAVDEAVFALNDMRPGMEEMYFLIQEEILKPRYQVTVQPQMNLTSRSSIDQQNSDLIEADVVVFSGAEGTVAGPDSAKTLSFENKTNQVERLKTERTKFLRRLTPWIPGSLAGLMVLAFSGFTVQRFKQNSLIAAPSISNPATKEFKGRSLAVFWSILGAVFLPIIFLMVGGMMRVIDSNESATFFMVVLGLIGTGLVIGITQFAARSRIAKRHPAMARALKMIPFLYVLSIATFLTVIWAFENNSEMTPEKGFGILAALVIGLVLVASAVPSWLRPEAAKAGVAGGMFAWLGRALLITATVGGACFLVFYMSAGSLSAAKNEGFAVVVDNMAGNMALGEMEAERPMAAMMGDVPKMMARVPGGGARTQSKPATEAPRVRKFFPETLLWQPQLLTDSNGKAKLELDLADSITTWRLAGSAVSAKGQLGSLTQGIRVFQDFFVDIDFPVALTQGDEVSVPIAIFNYLDRPQTIEIDIKKAAWFEFTGDMKGKQTVTVPANSVSNATCKLQALTPGTGKLTVFAKGDQLADAVERAVTVTPDGFRVANAINGRLDDKTTIESITIPKNSVEGGNDLYMKIYPGAFSQVVEGMDSIFRMPYGCFEQTSSTTYPNILTLNYMRETGQVSPELEMKALNFINIGYQRLLSYEVKGGGFDWFGNPPAHTVLTAYGLMEFVDMAKVYEIDQKVITRTRDWLLSKQGDDGTWKSPNRGIAEGAINNFQGEQTLRTTAYIAWAIAQAGGKDKLESAFNYLVENHIETEDPYTLALCAHVFHIMGEKKAADTLFTRLNDIVKTDDDGKLAWWEASGESLTHGRGNSFNIETTAIIAQAYMAGSHNISIAHKALAWLIDQKDPSGTWYSTQATVQAMRALLSGASSDGGDVGNGDFKLTFQVNGQQVNPLTISDDNRDVYHLISLTDLVTTGENKVQIDVDREANFAYQIVSVHYDPREIDGPAVPSEKELLTIKTDYSTTRLATDDELEVSVTLNYDRPEAAPMTLVDFGIPPGFEVVQESFQQLVARNVIKRFTANGRQVTLYFDSIPGGNKPTKFKYKLRAKFPVKAQAPAVYAYQYYEPEIRNSSLPVMLIVE